MQPVQSKLQQFCLLQPSVFKSFHLANKLQLFVRALDNEDFSFMKLSIQEQKLYVDIMMKIMTKQLNSSQQRIWVKLLFIDTLFATCKSSLLTRELIELLTEICSQLNSNLCKLKCQYLNKDNSFTKKLSSGLFKIKSMMNISTPKSLSFIPQTPKTSKELNQQEIIVKLLEYILSYERKKLQMSEFLLKIRQKFQSNQLIFQEGQSFESVISSVWMIVNLIKPHTLIAKSYKKIAFVYEQIKPLMVAMFVRLCRDSLMFYPYIKQSIEMGTRIVKEKYDKIVAQRLHKDIKKVKLEALSKDSVFIEVDNLISELNSINQTIFYLFCGKQHFMHISIEIPKGFFLNTTNCKLDDIHFIIKEVHHAAEKHQKSKIYISQMVEKLDESVSKVVEKERIRKSLTNIIQIENCQEQNCPNVQEKEQREKQVVLKLKKKKHHFFEEITEEV